MLALHYFQLLRYYRGLVALVFVTLVAGVAGLSTFFLFISPLYTGTAKVSLLPTQSELTFSQTFVRSTSINPANLMSQTHIEYLLSREVARLTVDRLIERFPVAESIEQTGLKAEVARYFRDARNAIRRTYNMLNSGKHIPIDTYTDTVLTLQDAIEAEMVEGTYILEIAVTWDSPEVAAAAANLLADVYIERIRSQATEAAERMEATLRRELAADSSNLAAIETQINALRLARAADLELLRVIDPAVPPIYASFPKVVINTLFAIAGALLLCAFVIVAADTFSGSIKTQADLERLFGAQALGMARARRGRLRGRWRRELPDIRRRLNAQLSAGVSQGAVMALGSDDDSRATAELVNAAIMTGRVRPRPTCSGGKPLESLGGAAEGFALNGRSAPAWLVIGLRAGTVSTTELESIREAWQAQGVGQVFGVLLRN